MPNPVSYLRSLAAHLSSDALGLQDGDTIPSAQQCADAIGAERRTVQRLFKDLKQAGALADGEHHTASPRVMLMDRLRDLATEEGDAHFRGVLAESRPKPVSAEAWGEVLGRLDTLGGHLSETLSDLASHTEALAPLPQVIGAIPGMVREAVREVVEDVVRRVLSEVFAAAPAPAPKIVRQKIQTSPGVNPYVTLLGGRMSSRELSEKLGISAESARRYAKGTRTAPLEVEQLAQRLCEDLKIE